MLFASPPELPGSRPRPELNGEELLVYEAIGEDPAGIDEIIARSGLPVSAVMPRLISLELARHVKPVPGGRFVKLM
jgi:DNA processing protein